MVQSTWLLLGVHWLFTSIIFSPTAEKCLAELNEILSKCTSPGASSSCLPDSSTISRIANWRPDACSYHSSKLSSRGIVVILNVYLSLLSDCRWDDRRPSTHRFSHLRGGGCLSVYERIICKKKNRRRFKFRHEFAHDDQVHSYLGSATLSYWFVYCWFPIEDDSWRVLS